MAAPRTPRRRGSRLSATAFAVLGMAVLLTACDASGPAGAGPCRIAVDSPDLVHARQAAHIADCDPARWNTQTDGRAADLPDVELGCLGSTRRVSLSQVKGPAVINFWSSNCGPCREEMPALQQFAEEYGDQVTVLGVNWLDTYPAAGIDLAKQSGVTYPSLADECGELQQTDMELGQGLPFFLFVKPDGSVSHPHLGGLDSADQVKDLAEKELGITFVAKQRGER